MNFSCSALFVSLFSTRLRILATVESPYSLVTQISSKPVWLMDPEITSSPSSTSTGLDSPVREEVSNEEAPLTTVPSSGILSPGFTCMISPTTTSSGSTFSNVPSRYTDALSGLISINSPMDFRDLATASS